MKQKYLIFIILPYVGLALKLTTVSIYSYAVDTNYFSIFKSNISVKKVQFLKEYGYPSETHYITTDDGYILTTHRIPHGKNQTGTNKLAVLMVHGMLSSSADFVNLGSDRALGLILADLGYDVWLLNCRGNSYSKNHTTLNPKRNPKKFYNFSWHEIGIYDIPAATDYILNFNGDNSLHYIGMSQGCTSFFVFASQRPEYNKKIKLASLMAPASVMETFPEMSLTSTIYKMLFEYLTNYRRLNIYYFQIASSMQDLLMQCGDSNEKLMICKTIFGLLGGADNEQFDDFIFQIVGMNFPSEISFKQFEHYLQQFSNGTSFNKNSLLFKFDYCRRI